VTPLQLPATPARRERRQRLKAHIDQIWAEQEQRNQVIREASAMPSLQVADRYAQGRIRL
jgi:hypothetical protein